MALGFRGVLALVVGPDSLWTSPLLLTTVFVGAFGVAILAFTEFSPEILQGTSLCTTV